MTIRFPYLPPMPSDCFVTERVAEPPSTTPVIIITPPKELASNNRDSLEMMKQSADLACYSHPCQNLPQHTPSKGQTIVDGVLNDALFQDLPSVQEDPANSANGKKESQPISNSVGDPPKTSLASQLTVSVTHPTAPVQEKTERTIFIVTSANGLTKEYYRPNLTVQELLNIGKKLAIAGAYPDCTVNLNTYKNDIAYASITFRKRIDHAEKTYRELCYLYSIPEHNRVNLTALNFAVRLPMLQSPHTLQEIEQLERQRTNVFQIFLTTAYLNGIPADPALESIYRSTHEQRLALLQGHPYPYEYIASTDCVIFAYKRLPPA